MVFLKQSMNPLYGSEPSGSVFILCILVLTLSNGRLKVDVKNPEMKVATKVVVFDLPQSFSSLYLDSSKDTIIPAFRDMALPMVGSDPLHKVKVPSSLIVLPRASKTCL
jgi:hypothetical protein